MDGVLVIGYGNTLRGDDGAGVRAAEHLGRLHPSWTVLTMQELSPEVAEAVARAAAVLFIDASARATGLELSAVLPDGAPGAWSHALSPASVLTLARTLYGRAPDRSFLLELAASSFAFSESLSPATEALMDECARKVQELLT